MINETLPVRSTGTSTCSVRIVGGMKVRFVNLSKSVFEVQSDYSYCNTNLLI